MLQYSQKQQGNALVVVVIILTVAIIGALGYVLYQNFIPKGEQTNTTTNQTPNQQETVPLTKEFQSQVHNITFSYPIDWSVVEEVRSNTDEWYASTVKVLNAQGKVVTALITGWEIGGTCSDEEPLLAVSTITKDPLELKGIGQTNFGYTIVETSKENYGVAFGLSDDRLQLGDSSVRCPHMSINYRYYIKSTNQVLGGITFGLWYADVQREGDTNTYRMFNSLPDAKNYAQSEEFVQIKEMIETLRIGQ
jgi:hypothetical protein